MNLLRTLLAVLVCLLGAACPQAQSQNTNLDSSAIPSATAEHDPEDAFLSPNHYTNAYFGFEFDFPPEARLKPIPTPATSDRRIRLLEVVGPAPQHAGISISAYEYKGKNWTDAKGILRHQLDQDLYVGVEELHGLSKTTIDGRQFYYFETRKGIEQHVELATESGGYVLLVVLEANDPQMVKALSSAFYRLKFFPPQEAQQYAGPQASAYEGPAISAQRLRELKESPPAQRMDPGKIQDGVYRNTQIGVRFEFPKGWSIQPQGAIEPAVSRYREKVSGEPVMGPRERDVMKACRRTLLSAWKTKPGADGELPYDEFGEVTLSAMPLACFPNIHFPDDAHDADTIRRFLVGLSFSQPLQRDMTDARTYEASGKTFVVTHGTIAYKEEGDALSRRISVSIVLTQHRGYLLMWIFAAPHDAELRELMDARMGFDSDPATRDAKASAASSVEKTLEPGGAAPSEAVPERAASVGSTVSPENPTPKGQPEGSSAPVNSPVSSRPSLLRPGETALDEQIQGKPLPKKSSQ
ncbi:MAG TPA: hypothetical protein VIH91_07835 [Terriglobales bacterium]